MAVSAKRIKNPASRDAALEDACETAPVKAKVERARKATQVFRRTDLVGKFPHIRHLPAPQAVRRLDNEERERILAAMLLD